jgi:hypothetical protein
MSFMLQTDKRVLENKNYEVFFILQDKNMKKMQRCRKVTQMSAQLFGTSRGCVGFLRACVYVLYIYTHTYIDAHTHTHTDLEKIFFVYFIVYSYSLHKPHVA